MHRVGRDCELIHFDPKFCAQDSIFVCCYGEIDCRCHIQRQIDSGRDQDQVIQSLVNEFMKTCRKFTMGRVIICAVVPPIEQKFYESLHGPITHAFPFVGTDQQRVDHTAKLNRALALACAEQGYEFFDFTRSYRQANGTLNPNLSDQICHIGNNSALLAQFKKHVDSGRVEPTLLNRD